MDDTVLLLTGAVFVDHRVLAKSAGIDWPPVGRRRGFDAVRAVAIATVLVATLASALDWILRHRVLPLAPGALHTSASVLSVVAVAGIAGVALRRQVPSLDGVLRLALPLVSANALVLGVALRDAQAGSTLPGAVAMALGAALVFGMALVCFAAMHERVEAADVPAAWRGAPIALVTAGLMSLAASGLVALVPFG